MQATNISYYENNNETPWKLDDAALVVMIWFGFISILFLDITSVSLDLLAVGLLVGTVLLVLLVPDLNRETTRKLSFRAETKKTHFYRLPKNPFFIVWHTS